MRTTVALLIGALAALAALAGCGTGEQGAVPDEAAQAAIVEILQAAQAQTQADRVAEIVWYTPETLHEYINGMAPRFVEAGFVILAHTEWRDREDEGPGYVELDLYDMGTAGGAAAVFDEPDAANSLPLPGGVKAYAGDAMIEFRTGRYYVKLTSRRDPEAQEPLLKELAEAVAEVLARETPDPTAGRQSP
ncbi:MAG: DUF6599 family protein [Phycisphaerae bacterium]|nr:DUF6599 family protein [Phycisphaerae bacterium]